MMTKRRHSPSRVGLSLTVGSLILLATTIFAQQLSEPESFYGTTAKMVCAMIEENHLSQREITDDVASHLLDRFLEEIDPQKVFFLKSDVDGLARYRHELDNLLKVGNVDFAFQTFALYRKRVAQYIELAKKLIEADHDFSVDESLDIDPKKRQWAASEAELRERWRKRVKNDILNLMLEDTPKEEIADRLRRRYDNILRTARQVEDGEILEIYLSALAHCFDPHSSYMSPETLEDFRIQMQLSLEGIGAALRSEDGYTIVARIVPGGAADKDGRLEVGDKIIGVGQEDGEIVDIVEMKLSRVVRLIRGPSGTKVRLRVKKAKGNEVKVYELTRQKIELTSSEVKGEIIDTGKRLGGEGLRIGIVHIPSFYRDFRGAQRQIENFKSTARDVRKVLEDFRRQGGVDAVIVDLRTNGGGALTEAIDVTGLFIKEGPVVLVKEKDGTVHAHEDVDPGVAYAGPLVVVCNRLSASASEIFAGAIKDYRRGIVVGDSTTHGKGTVQNVMPVRQKFAFLNPRDRGALKLTINQFYRVNGESTQNRGVHADIVLPSILDHMDLGESFLDNALAFDRIDPAKYEPVGMVTPEIISMLKRKSRQRVAKDPEFQKDEKEIERYVERKNMKTLSLNLEVRKKQRDADKAEQKVLDEVDESQDGTEGPVFPENHYNDELLRITVDYVDALRQAGIAAAASK